MLEGQMQGGVRDGDWKERTPEGQGLILNKYVMGGIN